MKQKVKKGLALMITIVLAMGLWCGCGKAKEEEASGSIMIYTSIYPDIIELVSPKLEAEFPNLKIEWFQGGTEKVVSKIAGEIEAGKVQADLVMVADPSYYMTLKNMDQLYPYKSTQADAVKRKDDEGYWYAVRQSNMILAYNSDKYSEDEVPHSFEEMTDPKYKNQLGMPNPLLSGTALVAAGDLSDKKGWDYFEKLAANGMTVDEGNSAVQNKLLTGEYRAAMILEENILKLQETKNEPLKVIYPTDGIIGVPSAIGIMKDSQNKEAAQAILDWWLSEEGQDAIVSGWMHSVRSDYTKAPTGAPETKELEKNMSDVDWERLSKDGEAIKEQFRKIMLEK